LSDANTPPQANELAAPKPQPIEAPAPAKSAFFRLRHWLVLLSFLLIVIAPAILIGGYLYTIANDQYASKLGFAVRSEQTKSAIEVLGGITDLSSSGSNDTDILYEFIQSQQLAKTIDESVDLKTIYSKPAYDPIYSFDPKKPIEDLLTYWRRMVRISYDASTGLIELTVLAFSPEDAQSIAQEIFDKSSAMINRLSAIARADTIGYAKDELDVAVERLKNARKEITLFRNRTQIIDPNAGVQGQVGILNSLEAQLANSLIELDILKRGTTKTDIRIQQGELRVEIIKQRIEAERQKIGLVDGENSPKWADLVGEYEGLLVDLEFAEQSYVAALSGYDGASAEASRQSRYLAAYIGPTKAEKSEYPRRHLVFSLSLLFLLTAWSIAVLTFYSIRDRR
jgi:capsular polysaccharide transport system permease protein